MAVSEGKVRPSRPAWIAVLLLLASAAPGQDKFAQQRRAFERGMKRPPLGKRAGTISRFARTRDPRALTLLMKRYRKPRIPAEFERYLIASAIGKSFAADSFAAARRSALKSFAKDEHAWLWYQLGRGAGARPGGARPPFLRADRGLAPAAARDPADLAALPGLLKPESKPDELIVRAAASVLHAHRLRLGREDFRLAALAVIAHLSNEELPDAAKLVLARYLAHIFRVDQVSTHPLYWRRLLSHAERKQSAGPTGEARPRFFGVEATGDRILFLIDLSDSMLEPLTPQERLDAQRVPSGAEADSGAIDWKKVRTRFDLAKVFLARYLRALPPKVSFAVIGFGDEPYAPRSSKKIQRATAGRVKATLRDIDKLKPWGKDKLHPHGRLRGATNIHGAFRIAFRRTTARNLDDPAFIDAIGWKRGCDTIFLLSDGRPTSDDFAQNDEHKGGRLTVNPETGETKDSTAGSASFRGPYARSGHLAEDVERMNLFRKAEIPAIAMGSADEALMRRLARSGLGRYRAFGVRAKGGQLRYWRVVGPFEAGEPDQWQNALPPETKKFEWRARFGDRQWTIRDAGRRDGILHLAGAFGRTRNSAAFATAKFVPDRAGEARLRLGAEGGVRVWLNGELIVDALAPAEFKRDAHTVAVQLRAGENELRVKSCYASGPRWRIHARIDGTPIREVMER